MTHSFPNDRLLTQLPILIDGDAMASLLRPYLGLDLVSCVPSYIRYKPETSCIVQYELSFQDDGGDKRTQTAFMKVYADRRAHRRSQSGGAARLNDRLSGESSQFQHVTYIPELDGVFQLFPADLDLRPLAKLSQLKSAQKLLRSAVGNPDLRLAADPELIRYKPGRKALLRFKLEGEKSQVLYVKTYAGMDPTDLAKQTEVLLRAGVRTAAVAGVLEKHNMIVHEEAPGIALNPLRDRPDFADYMQPIADSLWQLHATTDINAPTHRLSDEIEALQQVTSLLSVVVPDMSARLHRVTDWICRSLSEQEDHLVTSHGDFYDDQAMVSDQGLMLIDFDELRLSHPAIDAGNMLAHLSTGSLKGEETGTAYKEFRREALGHLEIPARDLSVFEAAGMLKLAPGPFRRLESDWQSKIERILERIEAAMDPSDFDALDKTDTAVTDPELPQLTTLMNRDKMSRTFAEHTDTSAELKRIDLVRHKPGRRAILRYEFRDGVTLFGKTFASKRGARVHRVWHTIASQQAFGPQVIVPETVAWIPDIKLFLTRAVAGGSVDEKLAAGDTELANRIAFALFNLHSSDAHLGRWHDLENELEPLRMRLDAIQQLAPELSGAVTQLHRQLISFDTADMCWRYRPIHRDMYHDQLLLDRDKLVVLDLDDASMSEPLVDIANFTAHLMLLGEQRGEGTHALQPVIDSFVHQYRQLDADFDEHLYSYLVATTLFRLAGIHVSRENGVEAAAALITRSEHFLHQARLQKSRYAHSV